jgi:hypothetical protein
MTWKWTNGPAAQVVTQAGDSISHQRHKNLDRRCYSLFACTCAYFHRATLNIRSSRGAHTLTSVASACHERGVSVSGGYDEPMTLIKRAIDWQTL